MVSYARIMVSDRGGSKFQLGLLALMGLAGFFFLNVSHITEYIAPRVWLRPAPKPNGPNGGWPSSRLKLLVERERRVLESELAEYPWVSGQNVSHFAPELGGTPVRAMVITTWRSGSTFLGDILNSHPATFYHYEPLIHFGIHQIRSGLKADQALKILNKLLSCDFSNLDSYFTYARKHQETFAHNIRIWNHCKGGEMAQCWNPKFWSHMCKLFPFQAMKTVRLRANLTRNLLQNAKSLNLKIVLLVRDPRGTMQSRRNRVWCPEDPDCYDPKKLCSDLADDYKSARKLSQEFPKAFRNDLTFKDILAIQDACQEALDLWGYRVYRNQSDLGTLHPVLHYQL
eukprot:maker-scaffold282_size228295-snap-gene-0.15 protein:Tk05518 transcript:maker-scaffold282_size228295-snap-gene-0.15-mRNA-1 annotation:"carbohydrate sulfotransferase 4-like"